MRLLRTKESLIFEKFFPDDYKSFGCGPGGIGDWFVPDTMSGLSVRAACRQHDHDYRFGNGSSEIHRLQCDQRMQDNMLMIVNEKSKKYEQAWSSRIHLAPGIVWIAEVLFVSASKILKALRHVRVNTYYRMVRRFGGKAYWEERK